MIYLTKGEFVQGLKDYHTIEDKMAEWKRKYKDLYYLRYEKIRSPLDYDVIYKKNKEPVRVLKHGGHVESDQIADYHELLEADMEKALDKYSDYKVKNENTDEDLKKIKEPLRTILVLHYKEKKTLKEVAKKYKKKLCLDEVGLHRYIQKGLDEYYEI